MAARRPPPPPDDASDQDALFEVDEAVDADAPAAQPDAATPDDPDTETPDEPDTETPDEPDTDAAPTSPTDDEDDQTDNDRGSLHLDYRGRSHVGLVRKNNQDSGCASATMLLVADGMGGAAAGDLASAVAVTHAREDDRLVVGEQMLDVLGDSIRKANNKIADLVADDHALEGMGTTVSGGMFDGTHFGVCHIGDSRVYLIRDGEIEMLTHDHSWVQSLIDEGNITEEEAAYHPHRSLLLKVLNGHPTNVPDTSYVELRPGDRLVLCSDGLCGFVDDDEILARASEESLDTALDDLIEAALQAGGLDNVTVIVAEVAERAPEPPLETLVMGAAVDTEIPTIGPRHVDLGQDDEDDTDADADPDSPLRPAAPPPPDDADEEDRRYAMAAAPRRRWIPRIISLVLAIALLGGLGYGAVAWGRTQYYVGASDDNVAIYQGLPQNILGLPLSQVYEVQEIRLGDLPRFRRQQVVSTIGANSLDDARVTVDELARMAEKCRAQRKKEDKPPPTTPKKPGSTKKSGSPSGSGSPKSTTSPRTTTSPKKTTSPKASASPTGRPTSSSTPDPEQDCT